MKFDLTRTKSILVIKLRAIGDVMLSTVVLRNLRTACPDARIDFLTEAPSREVVEGNPDVTSVLVFDARRMTGVALILDVRRAKYDVVIDLFGNPRSAIVTRLSGAGIRVGYRFGWRQHCYTVVVEPRGGEVHNTEFNLDALRAIGVPIVATSPFFPRSAAEAGSADRFFAEAGLQGKPVVALNMGGGWYTKRWPLKYYAELGDRIAETFHASVVILWGPGERERAEMLRRAMNSNAALIPAVGLKGLAEILARCSALVTNDSGPMHIAAAVGTPVLAIFGPTNPDLQGPVGEIHEVVQNNTLLCLGCNLTKCPIGNPCMEQLGVDEVAAAFGRLMQKNKLAVQQSQGV